jgi:hypothetical protein
MGYKETIPGRVLELISARLVLEAGFAAGPSFVAGEVRRFDPPVPLEEALTWMERFAHVLRGGHILLDDHTGLWFERSGFHRYDPKPRTGGPRPGVILSKTR